MDAEKTRYPEQEGSKEVITPQQLLEDNQSPKAEKIIADWLKAKNGGKLIATLSCGDARVATTEAIGTQNVMPLKVIAGAADRLDYYRFVLGHSGTEQVVVFQHYDGKQMSEEGPTGCGGLAGKKKLRDGKGTNGKIETIEDFIRSRITSPDIILQGLAGVLKASEITDEPIMMVAFDHRTYKMTPIMVVTNGGRNIQSAVPVDWILNQKVGNIYADRKIPEIPFGELPKNFQELIEGNRKQVDLLAREPGFPESQGTQNPTTVIISTSVQPASGRYPGLFGAPNTAFLIRLPLLKNDDEVGVPQEGLEEVLAQLEYPISHALDANRPEDPFGRTVNLIFETPNLILTREVIGEALEDQLWLRKWLERGGRRQIIANEVRSGKTTLSEEFQ